jgi:cellulose synthase/poly-beta-1,6-N-acetylglucosamine synthase-like glycosyltransferase
MKIVFWVSFIGIFYCFIGYPFSLILISKIFKKTKINKGNNYFPYISFVIAAHNEEKIIIKKLENVINLEYPMEKIEIIIASDNSDDSTNEKIKNFIKKSKHYSIKLYEVKERKGKTSAQNEAIDISNGEIIVFSDANSIWKEDAIIKLIQNFNDSEIEYVCGKLQYINSFENITSNAESNYWNFDLWMRKIESDISSVTAGNGAIYAIRRDNFIKIDPIECHDGSYPVLSVLRKKRAIYETEAVAYEKAGETTKDEFSRKIRMGRNIFKLKYSNFCKYNPFRTGIYSYFYLGHRYLRYSLYLFHIGLYLSSIFLM